MDFRIFDKLVAEFIIERNEYKINFVDSHKMKIVCKNKLGTAFKISDLNSKSVWEFLNQNKGFSVLKKTLDYLIKSKESEIEIINRNGSLIYLIEKKLIGIIEE